VRVIALDKDAAPYALPRAVHFDHEIMRIFQQLGVAEQMRRHARDLPDYEFRAADGRVLMKLRPPRETPSGWGGGSEDEKAIIRIFWVGEMEIGPWNVGIDRCPLPPPLAAYTLRASQDETRQKE